MDILKGISQVKEKFKSVAGVEVVERLETEIYGLNGDIGKLEMKRQDALFLAETGDTNGNKNLAAIDEKIAAHKSTLSDKLGALSGAQRKLERELAEKKGRDTKLKWDAMATSSNEALKLVEKAEKALEFATKDYKMAMDIAQKVLADIPETDGTRVWDSDLSDVKLVSLMKLELRRGGILLAHPWFQGERDIPTMSEGWAKGLGWVFKKAPDEFKLAGPWKKYFPNAK